MTKTQLMKELICAPDDITGAYKSTLGYWYAYRITAVGGNAVTLRDVPVTEATGLMITDYWNGNRGGYTMGQIKAAVAHDEKVNDIARTYADFEAGTGRR